MISNNQKLDICNKWEMLFKEFEFDWNNIFNYASYTAKLTEQITKPAAKYISFFKRFFYASCIVANVTPKVARCTL